jgi:hypothetical protein
LSWRTYSESSGSDDTIEEIRCSKVAASRRRGSSSREIGSAAPSFCTSAREPRGFGETLM